MVRDTPLHWAAQNGKADCLGLLLNAGAEKGRGICQDETAAVTNRKTALDLASEAPAGFYGYYGGEAMANPLDVTSGEAHHWCSWVFLSFESAEGGAENSKILMTFLPHIGRIGRMSQAREELGCPLESAAALVVEVRDPVLSCLVAE
ncbi:hypothetical protein AK812_SmicGene40145 [Symbiodinium microadriaticum]|uniref:Uncharacterized protein n=1 Tax=Symbiodinium microadriaticum TaxID=2951 RepID=A0A1Q9C9D2_SYMMI|nr:hypothetical protein AK812_SmicGene40145 [Symbiodinium microadriaticum]